MTLARVRVTLALELSEESVLARVAPLGAAWKVDRGWWSEATFAALAMPRSLKDFGPAEAGRCCRGIH
jgi:hypothetical protein